MTEMKDIIHVIITSSVAVLAAIGVMQSIYLMLQWRIKSQLKAAVGIATNEKEIANKLIIDANKLIKESKSLIHESISKIDNHISTINSNQSTIDTRITNVVKNAEETLIAKISKDIIKELVEKSTILALNKLSEQVISMTGKNSFTELPHYAKYNYITNPTKEDGKNAGFWELELIVGRWRNRIWGKTDGNRSFIDHEREGRKMLRDQWLSWANCYSSEAMKDIIINSIN